MFCLIIHSEDGLLRQKPLIPAFKQTRNSKQNISDTFCLFGLFKPSTNHGNTLLGFQIDIE